MSDAVQTNTLGFAVYGTPQVDYTVNGVKGCTYDQAVAQMGLKRAIAVEESLPAFTKAVEARQRKVQDLGTALANIAATIASAIGHNSVDGSNAGADDKLGIDEGTKGLLAPYGLAKSYFVGDNNNEITYGDAQKLQTEVRYALDVTNNDLQQDMATLQSFVSKRDNAYQMATKLMQKAIQTRSSGIRYIGG